MKVPPGCSRSVRAQRGARRDSRRPRVGRRSRIAIASGWTRATADRAQARRTRAPAQELALRWDASRRRCRGEARDARGLRERRLGALHNNLLSAIAARWPASRSLPSHPARARVPWLTSSASTSARRQPVAYVKTGVPEVDSRSIGRCAGCRRSCRSVRTGRSSSGVRPAPPADCGVADRLFVKRFMGRARRCEASGVLPFRVAATRAGRAHRHRRSRVTPPEISAFVLRELKHRANNTSASRASSTSTSTAQCITVPAYFNDAHAPPRASWGWAAWRYCASSTSRPAASLAYGLDRTNRGTIAVYDLAAARSTFRF